MRAPCILLPVSYIIVCFAVLNIDDRPMPFTNTKGIERPELEDKDTTYDCSEQAKCTCLKSRMYSDVEWSSMPRMYSNLNHQRSWSKIRSAMLPIDIVPLTCSQSRKRWRPPWRTQRIASDVMVKSSSNVAPMVDSFVNKHAPKRLHLLVEAHTRCIEGC